MKEKIKNMKGITLVVLIITIIVLLILAVVAITSINKNNIINHTKEAKENISVAEEKEKIILATHEAILIGKGTIDKSGVGSGMDSQFPNNGYKKISWDESDEYVRVQIIASKRHYKITLNTGDVEYEKYPGLKVGDIVNYTAPVSFNITWRVLRIENGQVLLVSHNDVETVDLDSENLSNRQLKVWDKTTQSYKNAENYLDEVCTKYLNTQYAIEGRCINVDDIDKIIGYDKTTFDKGSTGKYGNEIAYKIVQDTNYSYIYNLYYQLNNSGSWINTNLNIKDDYLASLNLTEDNALKNNYYAYEISKIDDENDKNYNIYNALFRSYGYDGGYWLNGSFAYAPEPTKYCWGILSMHGNENRTYVGGEVLLGYGYANSKRERGIRPVITLKSDIKLTETSEGSSIWDIVE